MTPAKRANFERLLTPRHIAFVGGADAAIAIGEARRAGFSGDIWAVNPNRAEIAGVPCLPDLSALPTPPDAVFLAIRAELVPDAVATLRDMGAGGIACYSAGFGEAHAHGAELEQALKANLGDMVLIGPNCYGLINYIGRCALWPFAHGGTCPGYGAAIITQSGMLSSDITMSQRSLPLAYMASAGNQADLDLTAFVDLLCTRDEVRAIGLHIEGLKDVPAFEAAALKSLRHNTPIVALKTGTSTIGESLAMSHTGSLAGSNALYDALFERVGIIPVSSPAQLLETLKFLCVAGPVDGTKLTGFTASGGGATMLADHAETLGLTFTEPGAEAEARLTPLLPPIATLSNPLDYTTPIWGQSDKTYPVFATALETIPASAAVLVQDYPAKGLDETEQLYLNDALAFAGAAQQASVPAAICATIPENMPQHIRETLIAEGVAPMQGLRETLDAIRDAAWWSAARQRIVAHPPKPLRQGISAQANPLTEEASKAHLRSAGLAVPNGVVSDQAGLARAVRDLRPPLALKMMSTRLLHKTEAGAVALDLEGGIALELTASQMHARVTRHDPQAVRDRFLAEEMGARPLAELVVGLRQDPQFGWSLTIGSGGILVELIADSATVLLPASDDTLEAALNRLKATRLLDGFRGAPKADRQIIITALKALAAYATKHSDRLAELEINPLFIYADHVLAVDALVQEVAQ